MKYIHPNKYALQDVKTGWFVTSKGELREEFIEAYFYDHMTYAESRCVPGQVIRTVVRNEQTEVYELSLSALNGSEIAS